MPNMNLNANSDWKQIGEAGADSRLMINKKNPHISSFFFPFLRTQKPISMKNVQPLPEKPSITAPIEFPILKLQYGSHIGW